MNYYLIIISTVLFSVVRAQDPQYLASYGFPLCSIPCIRTGTNHTTCSEVDINCVCGAGYVNATQGALSCLRQKMSCTLDELKKVDCAVNKSCGVIQNNIATSCSSVTAVYALLPPKPDSSSNGKGELSMAAEAAIGIACFVFVLFVCAGVWGLKRRRRREREDREWAERHHDLPDAPSDVVTGGTGGTAETGWFETLDHHELEVIKSPVEIGVWHPDPQELEATEATEKRRSMQKEKKKDVGLDGSS